MLSITKNRVNTRARTRCVRSSPFKHSISASRVASTTCAPNSPASALISPASAAYTGVFTGSSVTHSITNAVARSPNTGTSLAMSLDSPPSTSIDPSQ